jgi:hypothetical protein
MLQGNSLCSYLKQSRMSFFLFKIRDQEGRTGLVCGHWYQWEAGEYWERAWEGGYSANTVHTCMQMEK